MKKEPSRSRRIDSIIIIFILIVAFGARLYKIDTPLADFHSWRQADTAAVARNFVRNGFNLLRPQYDDISSIETGHENPEGLRFVEFPLYNGLFAALYKLFPIFEIHIWGRLVSIGASLVTISIIFYFVRREVSRLAAIAAAGVYSIFPFFIFYSRVVLPESTAVALTLLSILILYGKGFQERQTSETTFIRSLASGAVFALAILVKPTVIFFILVHAYLFIKHDRLNIFKRGGAYIFVLISLLPFFLWRNYIAGFPEGIPASDWLFTSVNTPQGLQNIFFKPAFFRWIFFERIHLIILGGFSSMFFVLGLLLKQKRLFLHSILVSSLLYVFVFQGGNVQHEYYQVIILPAIAIFTGCGIAFMYSISKSLISPYIGYPILIAVVVFSLLISWFKIKGNYSYDTNLVNIGHIINTLTTRGDAIVTDSTGDTTLLYLADRKGAPATYKDLHELKAIGYDYFVTMNGQVSDAVKRETNFKVIFENDKFTLFKL